MVPTSSVVQNTSLNEGTETTQPISSFTVKEERMTTFQHVGCSFRKLVALFVIALLWSAAGSAETASKSVMKRAIPQCDDTDPPQDTTNGYVLLLFFNGPEGLAAAPKKFNFPEKPPAHNVHPTGCIWDPDDQNHTLKGIRVMGGCPTDCASKNRSAEAIKTGDPLNRMDNKRWAVFFADPAATKESGYEALNNDRQSTFRAWQIRAKNSCHAGRILDSLQLEVGSDGYLGQIMIGYANTRTPNPNPGSERNCTAWTPNGP
jgi:hypothetical protein